MKTTRSFSRKDIISGFEVIRTVPIEELNAELIQMEHIKTGLRLIWLKRDEENKTFAITFETLPWNDTGVFHILEHSVLCGSDRFPVKEPFVELLKNSMNTFLNAMTFSDKTMYPVSSKNDIDFMNLMNVYLDAVFHPAIYHKQEIFCQEGWHYEKDEEGKYTYKGVVFNEMKGAFADSDELMENAINRALFPDTCYAYCSGGDPVSIPELTYEDFLNAHRRFYAPSNGIIYLDGDMDIEQVIDFIDREYLADAERTERIAPPAIQAPVDGGSNCIKYELSPEEDDDDKYIIGWAAVLGTFEDREKQIAMNALTDVLAGNNEAYLPKVILEKGLAEDVFFQVFDGVAQPWVKLQIKNCRKENIPEIKEIIFDEIRRLCDEGIAHERIKAVLANNEFLMNERDFGSYPQGLFMGIQVMEGMLYGGLPEQNLEVGHHFRSLEKKIDSGYFEKLLRETMLDNIHFCEVVLEPSKTLGDERRVAETQRLENEVQKLSDSEISAINAMQDSLVAWQASTDSEEALATLPHLDLDDIDDKPEDIHCEVKNVDGVTVLRHNVEAGEIRHITLYFDLDGFDEESLSELAFMNSLLGDLQTSSASAEQILLQTDLLMGRFSTELKITSVHNSKDIDSIKLAASFSALDHKLMDAAALTVDILRNTEFTNGDMILDLLKQSRQSLMQSIIMGGHALANIRVGAMFSPIGAAKDATGGYSCYKWLKRMESNWDAEAVNEKFSKMLKRIFRRDSMTISVTAGELFDESEVVEYFIKSFDCKDETLPKTENRLSARGKTKEGIVIPADIAFAVRGGDLGEYGVEYSSGLKLATRIISLAYLWNEIRVKGGAYGTGMRVDRTGLLSCYSYRDPNGAKSLDTYKGSGRFLKDLTLNPSLDLTGFIVGAVSDSSPLMSPRVKGMVSDNLYFSGITYEERCNGHRNLLEMTPSKLAEFEDCITKAMENGGLCIVGSEAQLKAAGELDIIYTL